MYEKLPQELKERGAFCLWKYEERDGRRTKVPYQTNGFRANSTNKVTFTDFADAVVNINGADVPKHADADSVIPAQVTGGNARNLSGTRSWQTIRPNGSCSRIRTKPSSIRRVSILANVSVKADGVLPQWARCRFCPVCFLPWNCGSSLLTPVSMRKILFSCHTAQRKRTDPAAPRQHP